MPTNDDIRFETFLNDVKAARFDEHVGRSDVKVQSGDEFDAMKEHVLSLYDAVEVQHSFLDGNEQIFDCVPIEQQPSLKGRQEALADAPDPPFPEGRETDDRSRVVESQLGSDRTDRLGNVMACPPGTIPMRRVTLDELTRHEQLRDFFRKAPGGAQGHPSLGPQEDARVHKYAHGKQTVDNVGGHSNVNVWQPNVGSQIFSLSQHWYAGGNPLQTVEIGWQVYPRKYDITLPVLFIYWTADGYEDTGCYNLDCEAFVQVNPSWPLGGSLTPVSTPGGEQWILELGAYLDQGNWWLYVGGWTAEAALGYYPGSLYGQGQLATKATSVDYGGEVVDDSAWPPMGSGAFANAGWQHAAFQNQVFYLPPGAATGAWASLNRRQPSPDCFTIDLGSGGSWGDYFFYGGPGGAGCS